MTFGKSLMELRCSMLQMKFLNNIALQYLSVHLSRRTFYTILETNRKPKPDRDWIVEPPVKDSYSYLFVTKHWPLHGVLYYPLSKTEDFRWICNALGCTFPMSALSGQKKIPSMPLWWIHLAKKCDYRLLNNVIANGWSKGAKSAPEVPVLTKPEVKRLYKSGVADEKLKYLIIILKLHSRRKSIFSATDIAETRKFSDETLMFPSKSIRPHTDLVETKMIDGKQCPRHWNQRSGRSQQAQCSCHLLCQLAQ